MKLADALEKLREKLRRYAEQNNFTCDICGREVFSNERICARCMSGLPLHRGKICPVCGRSVAEEGICMECRSRAPSADKLRSAMDHEGEGRKLIVRFKTGQKYLFRALSDLMTPIAQQDFSDCDAVAFIPMTDRARRKRGYNQSFLLAEEIARRTGKPLLSCLEKKRETAAQKTLGRAEREKNLKGCFSVTDKRAVKGKTILVADDTMTTGSTADEIALILRRAGAKKVYYLTATSVPAKNMRARV